jgi:hypothetical protein
MTPQERMQTAMSLGTPDRVPVMCQMSIGHMLNLPTSPVEFWYDAGTFAWGLCELRERYGFDGVLVSLHGHSPEWRSGVQEARKAGDGEEVLWKDGSRTLHPKNDLPQVLPKAEAARPLLQQLRRGDLPARIGYIPVSQGLRFAIDPSHEFDVFRLVRDRIGNEYSMHGEITSPFDYYMDLFGHEEGLLGLIDFPEAAALVLDHYSGLLCDLATRMCGAGVDAIKVSSPYAGGGFISRDFYAKFVLPYERRLARAIRQQGVHVYTHTCGAIGDRLDLLLEAGVSGIECLDPPPLGNVELSEAKRVMRGKAFIKGNIDSVNVLLNGTREDVVRDVRERLRIGREGGGFILSTACSVAPGVLPERLVLLRELAEEWGRI